MGSLNSNFDNQIAEFDFAKQGGAIGVYRMGLILPLNSMINYIAWHVIDAFTGALANVSSGGITINQNPVVVNGPAFLAPTLATDLIAGLTFPRSTSVLAGHSDVPLEFYFAITDAPITSGRIIVYATYFNSDI
jgi:hypothetical protein